MYFVFDPQCLKIAKTGGEDGVQDESLSQD